MQVMALFHLFNFLQKISCHGVFDILLVGGKNTVAYFSADYQGICAAPMCGCLSVPAMALCGIKLQANIHIA